MFRVPTHRRQLFAGLLCGLVVLSSCGSDKKTAAGDTLPIAETKTVMRGSDPASQLISEMYAQMLEDQGFRVERREPAANLDAAIKRLTDGDADLAFSSTNEFYAYVQKNVATPATFVDGANLTDEINAIGELAPDALVVAPPSPALRNGLIACTKKVADDNKASSLTQLALVADKLTLGAPADFAKSGDLSMEHFTAVYGSKFKEVKTLTPADIATQLMKAEIDCGVFNSVDGLLPQGMVALTDDKAFVSRDAILPLLRKTKDGDTALLDIVNRVSSTLTTDAWIAMMGAVVTAKQSPEVVAGAFLDNSGLSKKAGD